jgi:outer membrane protein assembly factor BamB
MLKGDLMRTGVVDEVVKPPMSLMWTFTTPPFVNNQSAPVVANGVAYFPIGNEVYAVHAETGEMVWQKAHELPNDTSGPMTIVGNRLLVNCSDGLLYALNAGTGAIEWRSSLKRSSIYVAPFVLNDKIYSGTTGPGLAISSLADGSSLETDVIPTTGQIYSTPAFADGMLYFTDSEGYLYSANVATRRVNWKAQGGSTSLYSTPVLWKDLLILGNGTGNSVLAFHAQRGVPRWSARFTGAVYASPCVTPDGKIYVGTGDGKFYALDANNKGRVLWEKKLEAATTTEVRASAVVTQNGVVIVGTIRGVLYALDGNTGNIVWKYRLPTEGTKLASIRTPMTIVNGRGYVMADDGTVYCFSGDAFDAEPPVISKARLEVKARDKKSYAYPFPELKAPNEALTVSAEDEKEEPMVVPGLPPIKATMTLTDDGSGLDESSIVAQVNGVVVPTEFKSDTGLLTVNVFVPTGSTSQRALVDGEYRLLISVKDWRGNRLSETHIFYVDRTVSPPDPPQGAAGQGLPGGGGLPGSGGGRVGGGG